MVWTTYQLVEDFFHQQYHIQSMVPELNSMSARPPKKSPPTKLPVLIAAGHWHPHDLRAWSYHRHLGHGLQNLKDYQFLLWNTQIASKKNSAVCMAFFSGNSYSHWTPVVNSHSNYIILKQILLRARCNLFEPTLVQALECSAVRRRS